MNGSSSTPDHDDILSMDAMSLSRAIRIERSITCERLMEATLGRIEDINPIHNAVIMLKDRSILLEQARKYDRKLRKGRPTGWLHGIPTAIKDVSNARGFVTTMGGSPLFSDGCGMCYESDLYVANMEAEGAIVIGKTNAPEGGIGSNTFNNKWGRTVNATLTALGNISAGGSSGGAAVAVATNMLALADGTDNMGSLRNPAGWNGIYSHRPTAGLVPSKAATSAFILPYPASTPGPMARTPLDCAKLLETMVGDRSRFDASPIWNVSDVATNKKDVVRIGWLADWKGRLPMEEGIVSTCYESLQNWSRCHDATTIRLEFVALDDEPLFDMDDLWEAYNTIRYVSTYETYSKQYGLDVDLLLSPAREGNDDKHTIKPELAWELEQGLATIHNTKALVRAREVCERYNRWLVETALHRADVLALPSAQVWPFPIEDVYPKEIESVPMDTYHRWMEVCIPVSFGGLPCVTLPCSSRSSSSVPLETNRVFSMGIQLFGKRGDDLELLRLANDYYCCNSKQKPNL